MHTAFLRPLRHVALVAMTSILTLSMAATAAPSAAEQPATPRRLAIAIHGGAGVIAREQLGADGGYGGAVFGQGIQPLQQLSRHAHEAQRVFARPRA
jgi:hypothetical protein